MNAFSDDEVREALSPIASLLSKSEKAQQKVAPGTWQHTMLGDNIRALRIASALMHDEPEAHEVGESALRDALDAFDSMIDRTEKSYGKFAPGTSQHTLQKNRLSALRIGESAVRVELDSRE